MTSRFDKGGIIFEAGVAELYDYSHFGPDPLKKTIQQLGLDIVDIAGPAVMLGDAVLNDDNDVKKHFGAKTLRALSNFYDHCADMLPPSSYYDSHWMDDNDHPWARKTFREVLDEIPDETARKYVEVAVRSDLATEPHLANALDGLKNILMDDPDYLRTYCIVGGIEQFITRLAATLKTRILLDTPVVKAGRDKDGKYRLTTRHKGKFQEHVFDLVVLAMPNYWLGTLEWDSRELRMAMQKHLAHYDHPAHYLRISILFKKPFWHDVVKGSFFMSDAFGGCCIYDESSRLPGEKHGVLGWLLAGNDAISLSNLTDEKLVKLALDSLPKPLEHGRKLFLEGKVKRWIGTLNAQPGGDPVHELRRRHMPSPDLHPGLFIVGDYLFDSTLNGAFDSADFATDLILTELRREKFAYQFVPVHEPAPRKKGSVNGTAHKSNGATLKLKDRPLGLDYFKVYNGEQSYEESFEDYFSADYTTSLIKKVWRWKAPYTVLDVGSASGQTLEAFAGVGVEAWGIENSPEIHRRTAKKWQNRNLLGDVCRLPFADNSFDFVYETCLCYLPSNKVDQAIAELFRVCRVGVIFAGITSDMTMEAIDEHDLFVGVRSLMTLWEWSEAFMKAGFRPAVTDQKKLEQLWKFELAADEDDVHWYPDMESLRCCFYSKPGAPRQGSAASSIGKAKLRSLRRGLPAKPAAP